MTSLLNELSNFQPYCRKLSTEFVLKLLKTYRKQINGGFEEKLLKGYFSFSGKKK